MSDSENPSFDGSGNHTSSPVQSDAPALSVSDLSVTYRMDGPDVEAVRDVSFDIGAGRTFGIVGESGCGKTTAARSIIGLLDDNGEITGGEVKLNDKDLTTLSKRELRGIRWSEVAMIPQNVMNALNPVTTVGKQFVDVLQLHTEMDESTARQRAEELFDKVGVDPARLDDYPHEFSGGMLQRAVIAMAISCEPELIIADEPTTALDVVVQDEILRELEDLQEEFGIALLVISHDIGVIAEICDDLAVMYGGELMERGTATDIFHETANPYTLGLKNSFPDIENPDENIVSIPGTAPELSDPPTGCVFTERCPFATDECLERKPRLHTGPGSEGHVSRCHYVDDIDRMRQEAADPRTWTDESVPTTEPSPGTEPLVTAKDVKKHFGGGRGLLDYLLRQDPDPVRAVDGVSFDIIEGEMFGIVGESGCGKSTLGRLLLGLSTPTEGTIDFDGISVGEFDGDEEREFRRRAQIIFQNPFESLNPRLSVRQTIMEPLSLLGDADSYAERLARVEEILEEVGLSPAETYMNRLPSQLSGGEQQRVAIARALIVDPEFILADEPVSMLDVSIRANILNILGRLRRNRGLTYGIISHDISLIRNVCDRTGVMYLGKFVELGDTATVVDDPKHPYTKALVDSVPIPDPTAERESVTIAGEPPSASNPPSGCRFHTRCPAVIQPEEFDLEQPRYLEIMDLRVDLRQESVRVETIREETDSIEEAVDRLRSQYFDGSFADRDAEDIVISALEDVAGGHPDAAIDRLEPFESPCERHEPALQQSDDRLLACHLYDETMPGEPPQ